mgnify:CR=1 FL=1
MDPNQIVGTGVDAFNSLPKSTQEALLNPAANTLGKALDGAVTVVCSPLLVLGILSKALLHKFSTEINQKINGIPQKNRDTSKLGLVVKAMEEARYQLNEDDIRKMYVSLISSTVDNRKNNVVNPRLATVVAQFGPDEAKLLKLLYQQDWQQLPYGQLRLDLGNGFGYTFPTKIAIDSNSKIVNSFNSSLDILVSLGIANDKQSNKLAQSDDEYATIEKILRATINKPSEYEDNTCNLVNSYINLTNFGYDLCKCIFE